MKVLHVSALAISMLLGAQAASASTVHPDALESATPGGDYSDTAGSGPNITSSQPILVGQTSLLGGLRLNCVSGDCSDSSGLRDPSDAFFLTIGADRQLTSLVLNIASGNDPALNISGISFEVAISDETSGATFDLTSLGAATDVSLIPGITGSAVFGPGTYGFFVGASGSNADFSGRIDWSLTATVIDTSVAPVPLPATLPLLLAGLLGFGALRRKRHANDA